MNREELIELGFKLHGHRCPGMPLGLRTALAAMEKLGVERAKDSELLALVEIGEAHCAGCFADGVQVVTGCTLGKGNIHKTHYGKLALTLVSKKQGKAVRAVIKTEFLDGMKQSPFIALRKEGTPASSVPTDISQPAIDMVLNIPEEKLLSVSEPFDYEVKDVPVQFERVICTSCGEAVIEKYARVYNGEIVCQPCLEQALKA